jgi:hypothetical protein
MNKNIPFNKELAVPLLYKIAQCWCQKMYRFKQSEWTKKQNKLNVPNSRQ